MADERDVCPHCKRKTIPDVFIAHLSFCRKVRCINEALIECPFNTLHLVPKSELDTHTATCEYKPMITHPDLAELFSATTLTDQKVPPQRELVGEGDRPVCIGSFDGKASLANITGTGGHKGK